VKDERDANGDADAVAAPAFFNDEIDSLFQTLR
jgi:hypothetical protein